MSSRRRACARAVIALAVAVLAGAASLLAPAQGTPPAGGSGHGLLARTPPAALAARAAVAESRLTPGAAGSVADLTFDDPLLPEQWYVARTKVFDAWTELPPLAPVRVAIIDSGIDTGHPEFIGRIVEARSFVGSSARDAQGHGTIVAGLIAAKAGNGLGIVGLAPSAEILMAKVVSAEGTIALGAEAKAIRWAVDRGARVINMSLGGLRDPRNADRDAFSKAEAEAVAYAVSKGVLVVAAVGNGDQAPREPWPFATYPAALPHVLGVSAIGRSGGSPIFSNRDRLFNDVAAPGVAIVSTFPRTLTAHRITCEPQGFTTCATEDFIDPEGTSFAAPIVTAIAANLLALRPDLTAEQVSTIIQRTATDATTATGCAGCLAGRDPLTGWGEVNGAASVQALAGALPPRDVLEPNDDAGAGARRLSFPRTAKSTGVQGTLDFWDDRDDVFSIKLAKGERVYASFSAAGAETALALWSPDTRSVDDLANQQRRLAASQRPGAVERIAYTAPRTGWYFVHVRVTAAAGPLPYRLSIARTIPGK